MKQALTLVLGGVPLDYSDHTHIVVAPHCFINRQDNINDVCGKIADLSLKELKEIEYESLAHRYSLVNVLRDLYNRKYNLNYSHIFWSTILDPWLLPLIQIVLIHKKVIEGIVNKYGENNLNVKLLTIDRKWEFTDISQFIENGLCSIQFNHWLYSEILKEQLPSNWNINFEKIIPPRSIIPPKKISFKKLTLNIVNKIFNKASLIKGFSYLDKILFSLVLSLKKPLKTNETIPIQRSSVESTLLNTIISYIDFNYYIKLNNVGLSKRKKGKLLLTTANDLLWDTNQMIKIALHLESGGFILGAQHGGHNYGSAFLNEFLSTVEINKCVRYFTWGWRHNDSNSHKLNALPSPWLSKFRNKYRPNSNRIIMVGTSMSLYRIRIESLPSFHECMKYRNMKEKLIYKFINDKNLGKWFYYRPYFHDRNGLEERLYLNQKFPDLNIIDGDLNKEILNCRLIILDHPGTTLNLALAANVPVVCYWRNNAFSFNKESLEDLELLHKAGIYFQDINELFLHVQNIIDDIPRWWKSKATQTYKDSWCKKYALSSNSWRLEWINYINKLD